MASASAKTRTPPAQSIADADVDRKSTRLNSNHSQISYAVFCLKKKKKKYSNTSSSMSNMTASEPYAQLATYLNPSSQLECRNAVIEAHSADSLTLLRPSLEMCN